MQGDQNWIQESLTACQGLPIKHLINLKKDVTIHSLPSKVVTPLISISNFYLIKQQLHQHNVNQPKLNWRIANCILRVFKEAYDELVVSLHFPVVV